MDRKELAGSLRGARIGVIVAGDVPERYKEPIVGLDCEPVALKFRWVTGKGSDFEIPVRDLTVEEIIQVVNRALDERRLEFGFRPIDPTQSQIISPGNGPRRVS